MAVGISQSNPLENIRSMINNNYKGVKNAGLNLINEAIRLLTVGTTVIA
ncbi:hypothetical protein [Peribacillus butanolivorans]